jgi:beta-glucosidase
MVRGYQGKDLSMNNTMMATVKHFALYGASEAGRDYNTVDMSHIRMFNEYFPPYKAAIDEGVGCVMSSFNEIDGIPATGNRWLLTDVLRRIWKFKGFVVSDYTSVNEMMNHGLGDLKTVAAMSLKAGLDMDMVGEGFLTTLQASVNDKSVDPAEIEQACRRILEAKYKLGLFEDPYRYCDENRARTDVFTEGHRRIARQTAAESFVLLKNKGNILPLKKNGTIALIGPLMDNKENMPGTWSVAADLSKATSILTGLREVGGNNVRILTARGSNLDADSLFDERAGLFGKSTGRENRSPEEMIQEAVTIAEQSDVVVAVLGESSEMTGESSSRTDIGIPKAQQDLLRALVKTGKPVVLVLLTGRPLTLTWEDAHVPSILNVWFGGSEAGRAVADVLFGDVNPSGKLPSTFPQHVGQIPLHYNHKNTGRPLPEGKWFSKYTSNYLDVDNEPLYPFGHGLSYTTFSISDPVVSTTTPKGDQILTVMATLTNTGNTAGKEVIQLYIRDRVGSVTRPVKELKKFQKIDLKPGEKKSIRFDLNTDDLKFYNYDLIYDWEPGAFDIMLGSSSKDVKTITVNWSK